MDREVILRASRGYHNLDVMDVALVYPILHGFLCEEHNKPRDMVELFIKAIFSTAMWLPYFEVALEHYEKKFSLNKLYNKERKVLQIF